MSNATSQLKGKLEKLRNQLERVDMNLTNTEHLLNIQSDSYKDAILQNSNLTTDQKKTMLGPCQPRMWNSSCLPALKKKVCRKQRKIYLADEQCYLENITTVSYHHAKEKRTVSKLKYKKIYICWSKCFQSKTNFEKITQQRMLDNLSILKVRSVFEKLEDLIRLGAGSSASLKEFMQSFEFSAIEVYVASLFESCYRYCGYDYKPFTTKLTHQEYKKKPMKKLLTDSKCKTNFQNGNGSTEEVYGCLNTTQCKRVHFNNNCLETQHKFHQIIKSIKNHE